MKRTRRTETVDKVFSASFYLYKQLGIVHFFPVPLLIYISMFSLQKSNEQQNGDISKANITRQPGIAFNSALNTVEEQKHSKPN